MGISPVVPTIVAEVAADAATQNGRPRHHLRLVRVRPDLNVSDVVTD